MPTLSGNFDAGGTILNIFNAAVVVFGVALLTIHSYRMYQDLATKERRSVSHRRLLPKITSSYKKIAYSTLLSVLLFISSRFFFFLWGISDDVMYCKIFLVIYFLAFFVAKLFMYWTFLLRLHAIYGSSAYSYSTRWLNFWKVFFALYAVVQFAMSTLGVLSLISVCAINEEDDDNIYFLIMSGMFGLQDIVFSLAFVVAFIVPLRNVIKYVDTNAEYNSDTNQHKKLIYAGVKITTLTTVTVISTIVGNILISSIAIDAFWLDVMFNVVCLCLMTPYYADALYYERICCCCIWCCTPKTDAYKSKVREKRAPEDLDNHSTTLAMSADTMDQVNVAVRAAIDSSTSEQLSPISKANK